MLLLQNLRGDSQMTHREEGGNCRRNEAPATVISVLERLQTRSCLLQTSARVRGTVLFGVYADSDHTSGRGLTTPNPSALNWLADSVSDLQSLRRVDAELGGPSNIQGCVCKRSPFLDERTKRRLSLQQE